MWVTCDDTVDAHNYLALVPQDDIDMLRLLCKSEINNLKYGMTLQENEMNSVKGFTGLGKS
jgi:hypothetical protein